MNTSGWKEYKIGDLFNIKRGQTMPMNNLIQGEYPYISSTGQNNGMSTKCDRYNTEPGVITVAVNGSVGATFYQGKRFFANSDVAVLTFKEGELSKLKSLFICTVIKFESFRFNYGRKLSEDRLKNLIIKLPTKDDKPDWEYMEQYMKSLEEKINIPKIKKHNIPLNVEQWKEYKIGDLFSVSRGERITKEQYKQIKDEEFKYPVVTATTVNNGVSGYYTKTNCPANTLTCAGEASGMHTFYQSKDTWVVDSSRMFIPKENTVMNRWIGLFLIPIFNIHKNRFSYGRKANPETIEKLIIKLPTKDGQPDWEFMENYMKAFIVEDSTINPKEIEDTISTTI